MQSHGALLIFKKSFVKTITEIYINFELVDFLGKTAAGHQIKYFWL
jgi:hypothetical protein